MSKRRFSQEQINILSGNPNVERCSEKSITYSKKFKLAAIKQYRQGLSPTSIFRQAGFNIGLIGRATPKRCLISWRRIFEKNGENGLTIETRGRAGGRPKLSGLSDQEKIKYLEAKVAYLKAENAFLAKLRKKS